ncbi:cell division protein ZapA [Denitratisoma sp. agr-D3]
MMAAGNSLDIRIQGKDYRVSCPPEEREALESAVKLLDARMEEVADKTRSSGEKLAVMVALNLAHELLSAQGGTPLPRLDEEVPRRRIKAIEAKLDAVLTDKAQDALF